MDYKANFLNELDTLWKESKKKLIEAAEKKLLSKHNQIDFSENAIEGICENFGIYLFQVKLNKHFSEGEFRKEIWDSDKETLTHTPRLIKDRFKFNKVEEWHPLYLGKSEKLINRINEHCYQGAKKTTYGLKLSHRKKLLNIAEISYNYYPIPYEVDTLIGKAPVQFLMTNLESEIRKRIKPWVGKQ